MRKIKKKLQTEIFLKSILKQQFKNTNEQISCQANKQSLKLLLAVSEKDLLISYDRLLIYVKCSKYH